MSGSPPKNGDRRHSKEGGVPLGRREEDRWSLWDKRVRDAILFVIGVAGIVNELFLISDPRPSALLFLGSLVGLPFVLQADERRRRGTEPDSSDDE